MFRGGDRIPPGVFMTMTPRRVAVFEINVIHSDPSAPNDPQTAAPACKTASVTLVWLRTTSALKSRDRF